MSKIQVALTKVECTDGQGSLEGDLEIQLKVTDGSRSITWPSDSGDPATIDKGGAPTSVSFPIGTYTVDSGTVTKSFNIAVTEVDKGLLGADDWGDGTISFDLTSSMAPVSKSETISLYRDHMDKTDGKVKVTLKAYKI